MPLKNMVYYQYGLTITVLLMLGVIAAKTEGSSVPKAIMRITFWGTIAITGVTGYIFDIQSAH
jgi:VIT1/CCC1 family predicted Fe2+/Mn2+ transporter